MLVFEGVNIFVWPVCERIMVTNLCTTLFFLNQCHVEHMGDAVHRVPHNNGKSSSITVFHQHYGGVDVIVLKEK